MFGRRERGVAETLDKVVYLMPPPRLGMLWCLLLDDKKRLESLGGSGKSPHLQTTKKSRRLDLVTTVAVITDSVLCWVGVFRSCKFANDLDEFIGLDTGLHGCGWLIVLVATFFPEPDFICFLYRYSPA